jgi:hypothetical protein
VKAALTVGRSDDLEHARRLISSGEELSEKSRAALGDESGELAAVGT